MISNNLSTVFTVFASFVCVVKSSHYDYCDAIPQKAEFAVQRDPKLGKNDSKACCNQLFQPIILSSREGEIEINLTCLKNSVYIQFLIEFLTTKKEIHSCEHVNSSAYTTHQFKNDIKLTLDYNLSHHNSDIHINFNNVFSGCYILRFTGYIGNAIEKSCWSLPFSVVTNYSRSINFNTLTSSTNYNRQRKELKINISDKQIATVKNINLAILVGNTVKDNCFLQEHKNIKTARTVNGSENNKKCDCTWINDTVIECRFKNVDISGTDSGMVKIESFDVRCCSNKQWYRQNVCQQNVSINSDGTVGDISPTLTSLLSETSTNTKLAPFVETKTLSTPPPPHIIPYPHIKEEVTKRRNNGIEIAILFSVCVIGVGVLVVVYIKIFKFKSNRIFHFKCEYSKDRPVVLERLDMIRLKNKVKILLLYPRDCQPFMDAMRQIRELLKSIDHFQVLDPFDPDLDKEVASNPCSWGLTYISDASTKVVLAASWCSRRFEEALLTGKRLSYSDNQPMDNVFSFLLHQLFLEINLSFKQIQIIRLSCEHVEDFNYQNITKNNIFTLPQEITSLIHHILGLSPDLTLCMEDRKNYMQTIEDYTRKYNLYLYHFPNYLDRLLQINQ